MLRNDKCMWPQTCLHIYTQHIHRRKLRNICTTTHHETIATTSDWDSHNIKSPWNTNTSAHSRIQQTYMLISISVHMHHTHSDEQHRRQQHYTNTYQRQQLHKHHNIWIGTYSTHAKQGILFHHWTLNNITIADGGEVHYTSLRLIQHDIYIAR